MSLFENTHDITIDRAYNRALRFLSYRPRSQKEIIDFLLKKKFNNSIIFKVTEKLTEQNLMNDEEFAKWWIEQRQIHKAKSKLFIKSELLQKGIALSIIEELLEDSQNDYETALRYFEKKKKRFSPLSDQKTYQKAVAFLQRRGFGWDTIKKVLENYRS